jgi:GT2 family glycosyltransferase
LGTQPLISIITVNYNGLELTVELLNSIRNLSYKNLEVLVVDNASKESPQAYLSEHFPEVKCIRSEANLGFAGGNNIAARQAKGDFIFYINNDAEITEGCLEKLVALFEKRPKLGIVSPLICYFNESKGASRDLIQYAGMTQMNALTARNSTIGEKTRDFGQYADAMPTAYAHGAAMMISRKASEKVGLMFEDFFLYYEELDWCERIGTAGFEIYVEPRARIYHKESATVGASSTLKTYYINRNRIYFMRRNYGGLGFIAFLLFLTFIAIPKNILTLILRGPSGHAKVFIKAIVWNIKDSFSKIYKSNSTTQSGTNNVVGNLTSR